MSAELVFQRTRLRTYVMRGEDLLGYIVRRRVSNSSPRGGAYRTVHQAYIGGTKKPVPGPVAYSRAEAVEDLLRWLERAS